MNHSGNDILSNEVCNANVITVRPIPKSRVQLFELERIVEWFLGQPRYIDVKKRGQNEFISFEEVVRFRIWVPNKSVYSWSIYSEEREFEIDPENTALTQDIVIRHGFWDRYADASLLVAQKKSGQGGPEWPNLKLHNTYVANYKAAVLGKYLKALDASVRQGICLKPRGKSKKTEWGDFEVMRLFNWGQVHAIWATPVKKNREIEGVFLEIEKELNNIISQPDLDFVEEMRLEYGYPPDLVKLLE